MVTRRPATLTVRWGTMDEASAYREQSRTSWQSAAAAWERERAAVSRAAARATPWLTGHAELQPGQTVLELACGTGETGISAAAMVGPQGRVIETDQAPAMVEAALRSAADRGLDNDVGPLIDPHGRDLLEPRVEPLEMTLPKAGSLDGSVELEAGGLRLEGPHAELREDVEHRAGGD